MNMSAVFGVSRFTDSYSELKELYLEAQEALKNAVFLEEELLYYGDDAAWRVCTSILNDFEERIQGNLREKSWQKIQAEIKILKKKERMDCESFKEAAVRWMHWISYEQNDQDGGHLKMIEEAARKMWECVTMEAILKEFEACIGILYGNSRGNKTINRELMRAIVYIKEHYCEMNLSLSDVVKEVYINKDYLSKLFKKELGIGFTDYVNSLRIKKACKLLKTTNLCSYEIAHEVGYRDESYFSRVFKNITGVRPNEYRRHQMIDLYSDEEEQSL